MEASCVSQFLMAINSVCYVILLMYYNRCNVGNGSDGLNGSYGVSGMVSPPNVRFPRIGRRMTGGPVP